MFDLLQFQYSQEDKDFILWLLLCPGIGRKSIKKVVYYLKKHELKISDFWVQGSTILDYININSKIKNIVLKTKKDDFEKEKCSFKKRFNKNNIRVICFWEEAYPQMLVNTADYPLLLFVKGNYSLLNTKSIAVVGTRRVTTYGIEATNKLVAELVFSGYTIVSGGMYGVDKQAHLQTIKNHGRTIMVLGYGFGSQNSWHADELQKQVLLNNGCVVSEYPPKTQAAKGTFRERNRIVAGVSLGTLVIEAALKSGTHITVNAALEAGREVFAVPGSIFNPYTLGTQYLINQGAKLVNSGSDIVAEFRK